MDWTLIFTVIGAALATIGVVYTFFINFKSDIVKRIDNLDQDLKDLDKAHSLRIDKLYEMFVENQKYMDIKFENINARFREVDQKFYDLLKSQNPKTNS